MTRCTRARAWAELVVMVINVTQKFVAMVIKWYSRYAVFCNTIMWSGKPQLPTRSHSSAVLIMPSERRKPSVMATGLSDRPGWLARWCVWPIYPASKLSYHCSGRSECPCGSLCLVLSRYVTSSVWYKNSACHRFSFFTGHCQAIRIYLEKNPNYDLKDSYTTGSWPLLLVCKYYRPEKTGATSEAVWTNLDTGQTYDHINSVYNSGDQEYPLKKTLPVYAQGRYQCHYPSLAINQVTVHIYYNRKSTIDVVLLFLWLWWLSPSDQF